MLDEAAARHLEECVRNGATLILTPRTGVKNEHNVCWLKPLPGPLADAAGVRVSEYDPLGLDSNTIRTKQGNTFTCSQWCDVLSPEGAEPIAWYEDNFFAGEPAATRHKLGQGQIIYLGIVFLAYRNLHAVGQARKAANASFFRGIAEQLRIERLFGDRSHIDDLSLP